MELIHEEGVARLVATEEKNVNMSKKVMIEHCFKEEGKHQDGYSVSLRTEK